MPEDPTYDENELLARIAAGDEHAFEQLFRRYRPKLYGYLLQITKSKEIAEELTMDIFLKLWAGHVLLCRIKDIDAFLYKIAHNKAIDFFRAAARQRRLQEAYRLHVLHIQQTGETPALDQEAVELLTRIVNGLPPRRRIIYKLSREQHMTYEEIARHLNLSQKTVKNAMLSALHDIRRQLGRNGRNPQTVLWLLMFA